MFGFFRKRFKGVAILETAMTLPIILYVIFFSIELVRIGLAQTAVDSITKECTFELMSSGKVTRFNGIFEKYKPWGIPLKNFRYYIRIYPDDDVTPVTSSNQGIYKMMNVSPYGGETIGWAGSDYADPNDVLPTTAASSNSYGLSTNHAFLNKYQTNICEGSTFKECGASVRKTLLDEEGSGIPRGAVFVLTVAVKFPFSSPFVAKLFSGGSNTTTAYQADTTGSVIPNVFILWGRGSGMVN